MDHGDNKLESRTVYESRWGKSVHRGDGGQLPKLADAYKKNTGVGIKYQIDRLNGDAQEEGEFTSSLCPLKEREA